MTKRMTPSVAKMSEGQIDKAVATYRAMLCKHRSELCSDAAQQVLGQPDYVAEQVGVLRKRVEAVSNMIIRHVKVNRNLTPEEALNATGRRQYVTDSVVKTMPRGKGKKATIYFFKEGRNICDSELENRCKQHGLKPADPYELAAVNEADPVFADEHPNGTHWKDENGKWCYTAFYRWDDERGVDVYRSDGDWGDYWWFPRVRK